MDPLNEKKTTGIPLPEHDLKVKSDTDHNPEMGYHFLPDHQLTSCSWGPEKNEKQPARIYFEEDLSIELVATTL